MYLKTTMQISVFLDNFEMEQYYISSFAKQYYQKQDSLQQ